MKLALLFLILVSFWGFCLTMELYGQPVTLLFARLLRLIGRWFWAAGEGLEHGFRRNQEVKRQILLSLEDEPRRQKGWRSSQITR